MFTQGLTAEDEKRIQEEYEAYKRERDAEAAVRRVQRVIPTTQDETDVVFLDFMEGSLMKHMRAIRLAAWTLCLLLAVTSCAALAETPALTGGEHAALDHLGQQQMESAAHILREENGINFAFDRLSHTDSFPEKFDLRERGVVTPVKNQGDLGTCWAFATVAASESSLLSMMGLTAEEYAAKYGEEMDLSERHMTYFYNTALPPLSDYPEGEYPYDPNQAGEGVYIVEGINPVMGVENSAFNVGGSNFQVISCLASGVGIMNEKDAPYQNSEGTLEASGDWSLPEEMRFVESFELKNANVLPAPAGRDADGEYVYHPEGTEAIKSELLKGHAVAISYRIDYTMPGQTSGEMRAWLNEALASRDMTEVERAIYIDARVGGIDITALSDDALKYLVRLRCKANDMPADTYDLDALDRDALLRIFPSDYFSLPYDELVAYEEEVASIPVYMSFISEDPMIYAQYTYEERILNHQVCVVGWDDTFPAFAFQEGHQPPADGAWIVKNCWDTDWGNDGYCYISYYDMNLAVALSVEYENNIDTQTWTCPGVLQYDYMAADRVCSTLYDAPVYAASVFNIDEECVLQDLFAMTGDLNATVTATVYLLNDGAASPTDGRILESVTQTIEYAGYHRIDLPTSLILPAGSTISITVQQRVQTADGDKYALVNTAAFGEKASEPYAALNPVGENQLLRYCVGVVNRGENYVSFEEGRWVDWRDAIDSFASNGECAYMAYDNLPIKGYVYPLDAVEASHDLDTWTPIVDGMMAVCPECGYALERLE